MGGREDCTFQLSTLVAAEQASDESLMCGAWLALGSSQLDYTNSVNSVNYVSSMNSVYSDRPQV